MTEHDQSSTAIIGAAYPTPGVHCTEAQKAYDRATEAVRRLKNGRSEPAGPCPHCFRWACSCPVDSGSEETDR